MYIHVYMNSVIHDIVHCIHLLMSSNIRGHPLHEIQRRQRLAGREKRARGSRIRGTRLRLK
jgi:hypothetical protein